MSKPVTIDIPHRLGVEEARRRIDQGFATLAQQIGGPRLAKVDGAWDGDRMTFSLGALGQHITGQLQVMSDAVRVEVELPGFLAPLANAIRTRVQQQGQVLLEKK